MNSVVIALLIRSEQVKKTLKQSLIERFSNVTFVDDDSLSEVDIAVYDDKEKLTEVQGRSIKATKVLLSEKPRGLTYGVSGDVVVVGVLEALTRISCLVSNTINRQSSQIPPTS